MTTPVASMSSTMPSENRLLALPAELRVYIYELVVIETHPLKPTFMYSKPDDGKQPAVTKVSRQVRAESLPIYYEKNTFRVECYVGSVIESSQRWLRAIEQNVHIIKTFEFDFSSSGGAYLGVYVSADAVPSYRVVIDRLGSLNPEVAKTVRRAEAEGSIQALFERAAKVGFGTEKYIELGDLLAKTRKQIYWD